MSNRPVITGTGGLAAEPTPTELVHGGFRSNRHHQAIEDMADERGMGRDILRSDEKAPGLESTGYREMLRNQPAGGKDTPMKTSKWSK